MKIIAFVGMTGSGKGTCTDYLKDKGYPVIHFGNMVVEEVQKRGMPINELTERKVREELRTQHGKGVLADLVLERLQLMGETPVVVLDGLYSWTEYKILHESYGNDLTVIAVFTPRALRYDRVSKRDYRPLTPVDAASRDEAEIENLEKGGPIARADYTLINDGDATQLHSALESVLATIL